MEQYSFPYRNKTFTVSLGGIDEPDTIEVVYPGNTNKYLDELGDIRLASKKTKQVNIAYREYVNDVNGEVLIDRAGLEFQATSQETFPYFYNMMTGNSTLGTTLDKMVIDGLLIHKYGLQQGVFGTDGNFYHPTWFDYSFSINNNLVNLNITVSDALENEVYTYSILNSELEPNNTGDFLGLPLGTYTVMVESPNSMPCIQVITMNTPVQIL